MIFDSPELLSDPKQRLRLLINSALRIASVTIGICFLLIVGIYGLLQLWPERHQPTSALLHAPGHLEAIAGRGNVALTWDRVSGAVTYRVFRANRAEGPYEPLSLSSPPMSRAQRRILEWLIPGVSSGDAPCTRFTDTAVKDGGTYFYRVAGWDGFLPGPSSAPVSANLLHAGQSPSVSIEIDASTRVGALNHNWAVLINSEHLSYMLKGDAGRNLRMAGAGLQVENRELHNTIGFQYVRAHGILSDDLHVYHEDASGNPQFDWVGVDKVYDKVLHDGMRPFVELSFMPAALAANPHETVFKYRGITSPPKDYAKWALLVHEFVNHLVVRYGVREVESWYFEVWNEPDLHMPLFGNFWHGSAEEYFRLYDIAADAVKSVDSHLRVGGPAAATPLFVGQFLKHIAGTRRSSRPKGIPLDFLSYHSYSIPFIDWRPLLDRYGFIDTPVFYTEWGVSPRAGPVNDLPYGAAWLIRVLMEDDGAATVAGYWTGAEYSDEQGALKAFFHGGFGLLGFDSIRKPRYWAYYLLEQMGTEQVAFTGKGDGFGTLVHGVATRSVSGSVQVLLANVAYQESSIEGEPRLNRHVELTVSGLPSEQPFVLKRYRIDSFHSNVYREWQAVGRPDWPNSKQLATLHERDALGTLEPSRIVPSDPAGRIKLDFDLPMPAVSLVELEPLDRQP